MFVRFTKCRDAVDEQQDPGSAGLASLRYSEILEACTRAKARERSSISAVRRRSTRPRRSSSSALTMAPTCGKGSSIFKLPEPKSNP